MRSCLRGHYLWTGSSVLYRSLTIRLQFDHYSMIMKKSSHCCLIMIEYVAYLFGQILQMQRRPPAQARIPKRQTRTKKVLWHT